jgi:glycogen operon protein
VFCRRRWFQGRPIHGSKVSDIGWFTPGGTEMSEEDWQAGFAKSLGVFLNGRAIATPNERGEQVVDDTFYVMFNASHEPIEFTLPEAKWAPRWSVLLQSVDDADVMDEERAGEQLEAGGKARVESWSLMLLRRSA